MHLVDMRQLVDSLNHRPATTDAAITDSEKQLNAKLPKDYVEFLKLSNGGEGFVGKKYVIFWGADELSSMNQSYEIQSYVPGLLVFGSSGGGEAYGFDTRTGELRWSHRSATPILAIFGSPRLPHVLVQAELETFAIEPDGTVGWRVAHSDVVTGAGLLGGRLVLESFSGLHSSLDPSTGRSSS